MLLVSLANFFPSFKIKLITSCLSVIFELKICQDHFSFDKINLTVKNFKRYQSDKYYIINLDYCTGYHIFLSTLIKYAYIYTHSMLKYFLCAYVRALS